MFGHLRKGVAAFLGRRRLQAYALARMRLGRIAEPNIPAQHRMPVLRHPHRRYLQSQTVWLPRLHAAMAARSPV